MNTFYWLNFCSKFIFKYFQVSVRLPYSEYKHIVANEVQLMVVANLLISPAEVYVMPGDIVPFKIFYVSNYNFFII